MGLSRSTFYDAAPAALDADTLLAGISAICDEFECYGYRRIGAALRHQGVVVNAKKLRRLMREHGLQPKRRRRYVVTTDSDHAGPIYPDLAKNLVLDGPNQLWVADLTYVAIPGGFVYLAAILDAWSRKVVGYAISRSMDARIAVAALKAAIRSRTPPKGCVHHSDRGSQYASEVYRELLATHRLTGSMSRRGNPYDNAKAESFMKTLKVEAVYLAAYETWLLSGSGVVRSTSFDQPRDEGTKEGFASAACVVHELEEAEIVRQLLLRDATVRAQPRTQQRPEALDRVDVDLAEPVAILVAGVFAAPVTDGLVAIAPAFQAGVDAILVGVDQGARGDSTRDDRPDRLLLHVGQHVQEHWASALDQAEDGWLVLLQRAPARRSCQPAASPRPPLFATSFGWPLCPATT